ncbi:MAG TPA: DUF2125 domain-containing protein [Alphaproteobacteria bacterium]
MRRIRFLLLSLAVIAAAAIGYTGFWYHAADLVQEGLARWAAARRAEGYKVEIGSPTTSGFPFSIHLRIDQPSVEAPEKQWTWASEAIEANLPPWDFRHVEVHPIGRQEITYAKGDGRETVTTSAGDAVAHVDFTVNGRLDRATLYAESVNVAAPGVRGPLTARIASATLRAPPAEMPPNLAAGGGPQLPVSADLSFSLQDVVLPETVAGPLGAKLAWLTAEARVLGPLKAGPPAAALATWRDAGGALEIKSLNLAWGPLQLSGNATVALDPNMQPIGAGTGQIRGYSETIDSLIAQGLMKQRDGALAKAGLGLLAKTPPEGGAKVLTVPLTVQQQTLFAGPVAVLRIPTIAWAK